MKYSEDIYKIPVNDEVDTKREFLQQSPVNCFINFWELLWI